MRRGTRVHRIRNAVRRRGPAVPRLTSGSGGRLADAELLHQASVVPLVPGLDHLAVLDLVDRDAPPGDVPAGRGKAHQIAVVRRGGRPAGANQVTVREALLDREGEVGE